MTRKHNAAFVCNCREFFEPAELSHRFFEFLGVILNWQTDIASECAIVGCWIKRIAKLCMWAGRDEIQAIALVIDEIVGINSQAESSILAGDYLMAQGLNGKFDEPLLGRPFRW